MANPFVPVARVGWVTLALSVWLGLVWPPTLPNMPDGMFTPIMALELMETRADVALLFAVPAPEQARLVDAFTRGLYLDCAFLLAFATFVLLLVRAARPSVGHAASRVASAAMLVEACADLLENVRLLAIVRNLDGAYDAELASLPFVVWLKWGALALCFGCLAPSLVRFGVLGRVVALLFATVALVVPLGYVLRGAIAEAMLIATTVSFIAAFLLAVRERRSSTA